MFMIILLSSAPFLLTPGLGTSLSLTSRCSAKLGMESGKILDYQLSASSSDGGVVGPENGRLNHDDGGGAWCPRQSHFARLDYLEIDLLQDHVISAVVIQGRFANGIGKEFATHFMVKFWKEGYRKFEDYRDQNGEVLLGGNVNTFQPREQQLDNMLVIASKIRIIPYTLLEETNICMRVELKGCRYKGNFFHNFLVTDSGRSQQSYLTNTEYSTNSTTLTALIGVLTVAIIVSIVAATVLFHYKKNSLSKMNSFIRNRAGALKKISRKFDNNFSFSSSDEGETSPNTDLDFPAYSPEDNIEFRSVSIIRPGETTDDDLNSLSFSEDPLDRCESEGLGRTLSKSEDSLDIISNNNRVSRVKYLFDQ